MNSNEFVGKMIDAWPQDKARQITVEQAAIIISKIKRFTEAELDAIFDKLLEQSKYQPKVADIFSVATDLGYLAKPATEGNQHHTWEKTDCDLCEGEGRLNVIMQTLYEERTEEGQRKSTHFVDLGPYSSARWIDYPWQNGMHSYIFRCCCDAGEVASIPKAWPRWDSNRHKRDEIKTAEPKAKTVPVLAFRPMAHIASLLRHDEATP